MNWLQLLRDVEQLTEPGILVCISRVKGSAPRAVGTAMLVDAQECHGTIGGGHLEYKAIEIARTHLATVTKNDRQSFPKDFQLGASLGQCCGGVVELFFQVVWPNAEWLPALRTQLESGQTATLRLPITSESKLENTLLTERSIEIPLHSDDFRIVLFGAGHVGQALVRNLLPLPCHITWVDERAEMLPPMTAHNLRIICCDTPEAEVICALPNSYFLIMTHSHALDQRLCEAILRRDDFLYCGMIGSKSKRLNFERRLLQRGFKPAQLSQLTCPIGLAGISGKAPEIIAIAVAAELMLQHSMRLQHANTTRRAA